MGRSELYYYRTFFQWLESPDLGSGEEKGRQSDTPLHLTQYVFSALMFCALTSGHLSVQLHITIRLFCAT